MQNIWEIFSLKAKISIFLVCSKIFKSKYLDLKEKINLNEDMYNWATYIVKG